MRIISGKNKGRRLHAPRNLPVRPTTDMAKESLFNILTNLYYLEEISAIDLFSGTGNISFEFASRGTKEIYALDQHFGCIQFINKISKELNFNITTYKIDVYTFLKKTSLKTDVIFADPPYDFQECQFFEIVTVIFQRNLLNKNGVLIIEHSKHRNLSEHSKFSYSKKYGGSIFSFFRF